MSRLLLLLGAGLLAGCDGIQSALAPSGLEAERVSLLFWVMTIAGTVILALVLALTAVAILGRGRLRGWLSGERFILWAGLAFPLVVLSALLAYGIALMGLGPTAAPEGGLRVEVVGEQWWWRVTYTDEAGNRIESANELHIPTGQPVSVELTAADVIHSFWVPSLAGKLDMIPGRVNTLTLVATEPGVSRGQCAEYCGGAHALMAFHVVAQPEAEFRAWLAAEAQPARAPDTAEERQGLDLFIASGCGACHTIRGTGAEGVIGPDLTHVGSRLTLAAATLPNTAQDFARWIRDNQHIKPENRMPPYDILDEDELRLLGLYLESLE